MVLLVSDLNVDVPFVRKALSDMKNYEATNVSVLNIEICEDQYCRESYPRHISQEMLEYAETGRIFALNLLRFNGMMLHASAVEYGGKAYLFSGPCGMGKSTHTRLWQSTFGEDAKVFNDDKPALRRMEDRWYAYGTPWCGKDHININMKVPLAGICFLKQAPENKIRRLGSMEAMQRIMTQTIRKRLNAEQMDLLLTTVDKLIREIPIFELENRPEPDAARLSYETMRRAAEEVGL